MSVKIKLHCKTCGNSYEFYSTNAETGGRLRFDCPYCFAEIDQTMSKMLLNAALVLDEVNIEFLKFHQQRDESLFVASLEGLEVDQSKN